MHAEVADHPLFTGSIPVGIMSGEKPRFPSAGDHDALLRELQEMGVQHEDTTGRYGEPERSVLVYGLPRERMVALGKKYGQESVIHSEGGRHHLIYTNGPNAGQHHEDVPGAHEYFPSGSPEPADNNTKLPGGGYFRLAFDFDKLHPEAGAGGAEVPRGAAAAPVAKHELGHKLWAAVSELRKAANPTKPCPECKGTGKVVRSNNWGSASFKCNACMGHGKVLAEPDPKEQPGYHFQKDDLHDVFGHTKTGADFGHYGEDHAWRSHVAMYSPPARRALATETRGQNAVFHFGPNGKANRANPTSSVFPDQKAALMPEEFSRPPGEPVQKSLNLMSQERSAVADDKMPRDPRTAFHGLYKTLREEVEAYEAECVALRKAETARLDDKKRGRKSVKKDELGINSPRDPATGIAKTSATEGGMGEGGAAGFAMSEDDARAESYAKGEMDLCKACGLKRGAKHDCDEVESYAKGELEKARTKTGDSATIGGGGVGIDGGSIPSPPPPPAPAPPADGGGAGRPTLPGELAHSELGKDEPDGDGERAPKIATGSTLAAGSSPTSPGPKPGVTPATKAPKIQLPQTKEGGNGVTIKKTALPGAAPTAAPSAATAAAPKAPKLPGIKAPKLPGVGKPAAAAAPKTPPMGAGTPAPNIKSEPDAIAKAGPSSLGPRAMEARKKFGARTQQEQAAKLPGVQASVGNLMDNMMATGPLNPGQPLSIKPIASAPAIPVGVRPSATGGRAPAPQPRAAIPMVQRVAASLTAPPAAERAGAKLPGSHLFAPKAIKSEKK